jgi:hypothetical protein
MNEEKDIKALKENIRHAKEIIKEVSSISEHLRTVKDLEKSGYKIKEEEKKLLANTIKSLMSQLEIINNSTPEIVNSLNLFKKIPSKGKSKTKKELVSFKYNHPSAKKNEAIVTVKKSQKTKFIKELSLTDSTIDKLKKKYNLLAVHKKEGEYKKPSAYAKLSNKLFSELSRKMVKKGYFVDLNRELRKANMSYLSHTYISMSFLTSLIAFFVSFLIFVFLLIFSVSPASPFVFVSEESILIRFLKFFAVPIIVPIITFFLFVYYPSAEKKAIASKINHELPFVTIHMAAIAGSNVEPTNIFKIVASGKEYPFTRKEIKKLLNQINLYGYDLVSALRSSASFTSSSRLSELFSGFATTITSGGNLEAFLAKRADTLIFDYKTESEKSIRSAETFMDIYISVVIAAPMILTLLLVMMSISPALSLGLSLEATNLLILLAIAFINIIFLVFLHLKQPNI